MHVNYLVYQGEDQMKNEMDVINKARKLLNKIIRKEKIFNSKTESKRKTNKYEEIMFLQEDLIKLFGLKPTQDNT